MSLDISRKHAESFVFTMQNSSRPFSRPASTNLDVFKTYCFFNIQCLEAGLDVRHQMYLERHFHKEALEADQQVVGQRGRTSAS